MPLVQYAGGQYGRHDFAVICPCAPKWHETIDHFLDRMFRGQRHELRDTLSVR